MNLPPNIDTRRFKRLENGHMTNEALSVAATDLSMCNFCGAEQCKLRDKVLPAIPNWARPSIRSCARFIPVLTFSVLAGLELDEWNTIRVGAAWNQRLSVGNIVAVGDTANKRVVRSMRVSALHTGSVGSVCAEHSLHNHAILAAGYKDAAAAEKEMLRIMRTAYGTNFAAPDRSATAIYLEKLT